jgi:hypothetical protein
MTLHNTPFLSRIFAHSSLIALCAALSACNGSNSNNTDLGLNQAEPVISLPASEPAHEPIVDPITEPVSQPVAQRAPLTITLSWTAPFTRENGEPLAMGDISGYEIVTESSALQLNSVSVPTADVTVHTFENLTPADYAFSIYTYDNENNRSQPSSSLTILESQFPLQ